MLRRLFVIVALVALLSAGAPHAFGPDMAPNEALAAETTSGPNDGTERTADMDPNGLHARRADSAWTAWLHDMLGSLVQWIV